MTQTHHIFVPLLSFALWLGGYPTDARAEKAVSGKSSMQKEIFGKTADGEPVEIYTLTNAHGLKGRVMTWGAGLVNVLVPDKSGELADITLGFDKLDKYLTRHPYFGTTTGRYANRIAKGKFTLDGKTYTLAVNNGPNALHGGLKGFDQRNWKGEPVANGVRFSYTSVDGEEGYPGTLKVTVTYTLSDQDELRLDYEATTDKPTVVNLTNHAYWNLKGAGEGDILDHVLTIHASKYTVFDENSIPTGKIEPVAGTPLDFTKPKAVGKDFAQLKGDPGGYDDNYVLDKPKAGALSLAAEVYEPKSGRVMEISTTEPGVQFYTGNHLSDVAGKGGKTYVKNGALCLETQHYPDSPNHPDFPSTVLRPGETFRSSTVYLFKTK
jgi:aldose 1-epimerase